MYSRTLAELRVFACAGLLIVCVAAAASRNAHAAEPIRFLRNTSTTQTMQTPDSPRQDLPFQPPGVNLEKQGIVLPLGDSSAWDGGMVESPVVWFDSTRRRYAMVYTGYRHVVPGKRGYRAVGEPQIGLAWSDDLMIWEKDPRNPVFGGSGVPDSYDKEGACGPFIWFERGTYYLFYFGTTEVGYERGTKCLHLATSTDLVTWQRHAGNPIITPGGDGWRRDAIWHPNIVKAGPTYYLFFNASGVVEGIEEEFIGFATSVDLFHWSVDDARSPVLVGSRRKGAWDSSGRTGDPSLFRHGGRWFMAYYSWDRKNAQDGLAWTTEKEFPVGWRVWPGNPVLRIGPPGSFDAQHAAKPFIWREKGKHYHFYTAVDDNERREIALAVARDPQ